MPRTNRKKRSIDQTVDADSVGITVYSQDDDQSLHGSLNAEFIFYQILLRLILDDNDADIFEEPSLVEYFEPEDRADRQVLKVFDANYRPSEAIYWYTREPCIYRPLNKGLRTQNIDDIIPFGHLIQDLNAQLSEEHAQFIEQQKATSIRVYRGQLISNDELNRLQTTKGQLVSMSTYLSTSTNRGAAIQAATDRVTPTDGFASILFEIAVNLKASSSSYADIRHLSALSDEEEIMFKLGTIFRLDQITYDAEQKVWIAGLTLCSQDDTDLKKFFTALESRLTGQNQLLALGDCFIQMMKYDRAKEFYQKVLDANFVDSSPDLAHCYYGLAVVSERRGLVSSAIDNFNKAIGHLLRDASEEAHPLLSQCFNHLGDAHAKNGDHIKAFQFYEKAMNTAHNVPSITYSGLAHVHANLHNPHLALHYFQFALDHHPPTAHAAIANVQIEMGKAYVNIGEIDEASKIFEKTLEAQKRIFGADHPDVSYTYAAMALMHLDLNEHARALELLDKALRIQLDSLPSSHADFADTYRHFGDVHMAMGDIDQALTYYHRALDNQQKTLAWNHPAVAVTYKTIAAAHRKRRDYKQALVFLQKRLDSERTRTKPGDASLSNAYKSLADVYLDKGDSDQYVHYSLQFISNELHTKAHEHMSLADTYQIVANIYYRKRMLNEALVYYNRLLDCHLQKKPLDDAVIKEIYTMIGRVYLKKTRIVDSLKYYDTPGSNSSKLKYDDVNNVHFEKRHLDQAFNHFEAHLKQQILTRSTTDSSLADAYQILANICLEKQNGDKALDYLLKWLDTKLLKRAPDDPALSELYEIIGTLYLQKTNYNGAVIYFNKLIDCQLAMKTFDHPMIANVYKTIGKIYLRKNPFDPTSNYLMKNVTVGSKLNLKSIQAEKQHLERTILYFYTLLKKQIADSNYSRDFSIGQIYVIIANLFLEKQDGNQALAYYHHLLQLHYRKDPYAYFALGQTYEVIAKIYQRQRNPTKALQNFRQALSLYQQMNPKNANLVNSVKYNIREITTPI